MAEDVSTCTARAATWKAVSPSLSPVSSLRIGAPHAFDHTALKVTRLPYTAVQALFHPDVSSICFGDQAEPCLLLSNLWQLRSMTSRLYQILYHSKVAFVCGGTTGIRTPNLAVMSRVL